MPRSTKLPKCILAAFLSGLFATSALADDSKILPTPIRTVSPEFQWETLSGPVEVSMMVNINKFGYVTDAKIEYSENFLLDQPCLDAIEQWRYTPMKANGVAVATKFVQRFRYNGESIVTTRLEEQSKDPKAVRKVAPEIDRSLSNITGSVNVAVELDESGQIMSADVKESTHEELNPSTLSAVRKWKFKPAIENGKPVATRLVIPFIFKGQSQASSQSIARFDARPATSIPVPDRPARATRRIDPKLTYALMNKTGKVDVTFTVDEFGFVETAEAIQSNDEYLAIAATEAALKWKFEPALKDGEFVRSRTKQVFLFNSGMVSTEEPKQSDHIATPSKRIVPKLPEQLSNTNGFVYVQLDVDRSGIVTGARAKQASHEEAVQPTLNAALQWKFKPALKSGNSVSSSIVVPFVFGRER